jgi:hypothetical protein
VKAEELHAIGRMNGLGNYVRTRDAFMSIPRISYEEWKRGSGELLQYWFIPVGPPLRISVPTSS